MVNVTLITPFLVCLPFRLHSRAEQLSTLVASDVSEILMIKAKFHCATQVADLVADVCVSQAGRNLVESQLRTGLRPDSSYFDVSR